MKQEHSIKTENKNILKIIFMILSIIVGILGFVKGVFSVIDILKMNKFDFSGPLLNYLFAFLVGGIYFSLTAIIIVAIWGVYRIIMRIIKKK